MWAAHFVRILAHTSAPLIYKLELHQEVRVTELYDWNPMPHKVDVRCEHCGELAVFEFAEVVKIEKKKDVPFFQQSKLFEYALLSDSCGHRWHGAFFFQGLHRGINSISELPDGYSTEDWQHSKYSSRSHGYDLGSLSCNSCNTNKIHALEWPQEAFFSIEYKGQVLWAYNRESAMELYNFISAAERKELKSKWGGFLLHIPTIFKTKKAREPVAKKLRRLLF